ncbi:MAG TPA: MgtC/SapB family protein [Bryobacteraceae bacterium]|nr:MgtC/SapB family protein [Bryobacteraceae bacterium]
MQPLTFDWHVLQLALERIAIAWLLVMPTGFWSERQGNAVGIRTFPLVSMASCGFLLLLQSNTADSSRVLQGLVTGIGFVGGGAIVREGMSVRGTATAASIWAASAIGSAVALGRIEFAVVLALMDVFTMVALVPIKRYIEHRNGDGPRKVS